MSNKFFIFHFLQFLQNQTQNAPTNSLNLRALFHVPSAYCLGGNGLNCKISRTSCIIYINKKILGLNYLLFHIYYGGSPHPEPL